MDDAERKALANIEQFGCQVMHVLGEGELPPFSYSVGIQSTSLSPEVVVIGLKQEVAHFVVNEYNRRVREGEFFTPGERYSGFLEGFDVAVEKVDRIFYKDYFGWNLWLYNGDEFEIVQLVYPNTSGVWPWDPQASEWFRKWQPILNSSAACM